MIKAIIFDFDGVIVDSEMLHYKAFLQMFSDHNLSFEYSVYVERYIGFDDRDGFAAIANDFGIELAKEDIPKLIEKKAALFEKLTKQGIPPCPGILPLIESVSAQLPIAIASGATRQDIEVILRQLGNGDLKQKFKTIVTADDVAHSKPDPTTYLLAAKQIGIQPQHCLAIEDTKTGLNSARSAAMHTLAVETTYPASVLKDCADHVVKTLEEVNLELIHKWYA